MRTALSILIPKSLNKMGPGTVSQKIGIVPRARNVIESIMWHAYSEKFYNLPKEDRDAVVKFVESI